MKQQKQLSAWPSLPSSRQHQGTLPPSPGRGLLSTTNPWLGLCSRTSRTKAVNEHPCAPFLLCAVLLSSTGMVAHDDNDKTTTTNKHVVDISQLTKYFRLHSHPLVIPMLRSRY